MPTATATKTEKATNGKQDTPLADNEERKPGLPTIDLKALAGKVDWSKLPDPVKVPKGTPSTRPSEEEIPEQIRDMVEEALKADEYFELPIEDDTIRAAFVQFVRAYCYVRTLPDLNEKNEPTGRTHPARLTSRVTIMDDGKTVRYSVSNFKERAKK